MKRPSHESFKEDAFQIPDIKEGYDALEEEFSVVADLIRARNSKDKSQ